MSWVREFTPDEAFAGPRAAAMAEWQTKVRQREEELCSVKREL